MDVDDKTLTTIAAALRSGSTDPVPGVSLDGGSLDAAWAASGDSDAMMEVLGRVVAFDPAMVIPDTRRGFLRGIHEYGPGCSGLMPGPAARRVGEALDAAEISVHRQDGPGSPFEFLGCVNRAPDGRSRGFGYVDGTTAKALATIRAACPALGATYGAFLAGLRDALAAQAAYLSDQHAEVLRSLAQAAEDDVVPAWVAEHCRGGADPLPAEWAACRDGNAMGRLLAACCYPNPRPWAPGELAPSLAETGRVANAAAYRARVPRLTTPEVAGLVAARNARRDAPTGPLDVAHDAASDVLTIRIAGAKAESHAKLDVWGDTLAYDARDRVVGLTLARASQLSPTRWRERPDRHAMPAAIFAAAGAWMDAHWSPPWGRTP